MELFRSEASRSFNRLHGDVSLAPPVSWQLIGLFLAAMLALALLFLSIAGYAQRVTARGFVASDRGVLRITPPRAGTVLALAVREGVRVRKGQLLARIAMATVAGSDTLEARRAAAARKQAQALAQRSPALEEATAARLAALRAQLAAERASLVQVDRQLAEQRLLLASADEDLNRAREIARRGFVSGNDLRVREETRTVRRQGLLRMQQDRGEMAARITVSQADARREEAELTLSQADLLRAQGELAAQAAADSAQPWLDVTAPEGGVVTGVDGAPGTSVRPDHPLLTIVPHGAGLIVKLAVPPSGVAFVLPGQSVAVAVDAFPREIFGTLPARITYVTAATVPTGEAAAPSFMVEARLQRSFVRAYESRQPLRPGMSLSATIVTRRLSLLRWLLDPLYAVMER